MKSLFLIFIILTNCMAEYKNTNYIEVVSGTAKGTAFNSKKNENVALEGSGYNIHLTTYNDYYWDRFFVTSALSFSAFTKKYSRTYNKPAPDQHFVEISEASVNYKFTDNDIGTIGILSFKKGAFSEYTKSGLRQAEGLMTLYYLNMPGIFYTKYINDYKIQIGYAAHTSCDLIAKNRYEHSQEGSDIAFLFASKTYNKQTIKVNISHAKIMYNTVQSFAKKDIEELGILDNIGIGYVYDDRDQTGNLFYTIAAVSQTKFDGTALTNNTPIEAPGVKLSKEDARIGYSLLLGVKKDIDGFIGTKEGFIGSEIFYASKYWVSLVTDEVSTNEYAWGDIGTSYKVYTGISLSPKIKTSINYRYSNFDYQKLKGGNSVQAVDTHEHTVYIRLDYLF